MTERRNQVEFERVIKNEGKITRNTHPQTERERNKIITAIIVF